MFLKSTDKTFPSMQSDLSDSSNLIPKYKSYYFVSLSGLFGYDLHYKQVFVCEKLKDMKLSDAKKNYLKHYLFLSSYLYEFQIEYTISDYPNLFCICYGLSDHPTDISAVSAWIDVRLTRNESCVFWNHVVCLYESSSATVRRRDCVQHVLYVTRPTLHNRAGTFC